MQISIDCVLSIARDTTHKVGRTDRAGDCVLNNVRDTTQIQLQQHI